MSSSSWARPHRFDQSFVRAVSRETKNGGFFGEISRAVPPMGTCPAAPAHFVREGIATRVERIKINSRRP